ncbi:Hydrogen cyanide synthase subunit HcnC [Planctomycetales bacterium 10988]|nr:Hydrogen cyanide synthase subunit HcnC [Planctomycetales bacterium 10988]
MVDFLIVGAGVVGLSLAYRLAGRGASVCVLDRREPGQEASWAGAGMVPPAGAPEIVSPTRQLAAWSAKLHPELAASLKEETGIDNGFHYCGAWECLPPSLSEAESHLQNAWNAEQIPFESTMPEKIKHAEPSLTLPHSAEFKTFYLPTAGQIRNPRHLKALLMACQLRGVKVIPFAEVEAIPVDVNGVIKVETAIDSYTAKQYVLTAGAWTGRLARQVGVPLEVEPIRGQIVLLKGEKRLLFHDLNEGSHYLVSRPDGRLLVGSTQERVGFRKENTAGATANLLKYACDRLPEAATMQIEKSWSGLRPGTPDKLPYLGRLGDTENLFIAAGHFRSGLEWSPATAEVMTQLLLGEELLFDLSPFAPGRSCSEETLSSLDPKELLHL